MGTDHHHHHHHYHQDVGRADRPSPNPYRLTRSRTNRILCGVCGGLAEYFGWKAWHVRLAAVLSLMVFHPATIVAYIVGCFVMKRSPYRYAPGRSDGCGRAVLAQRVDPPRRDLLSTEAHVPRPRGAHREHGARRDHRGVWSRPRLPRDRRQARAIGSLALAVGGKSPAAFDERCIPSGLRCSSVEYAQYAPSSRLASRAPRPSRCNARFHHGLLALLLPRATMTLPKMAA